MCSPEECSKTSCPFAFTECSEKIQNYGCLPEPHQILEMKVIHGKTWACHSDKTKPCVGAINYFADKGLIAKVSDPDLLTLDDNWEAYCR